MFGDYIIYYVYLNISNPLSTCEIYNFNQLVSFGVSLCHPEDRFSKTIGAEHALKSALNRLNYQTGKPIIHPKYYKRFLSFVPKVCHDNTLMDEIREELLRRNYIDFLKTIFNLPVDD